MPTLGDLLNQAVHHHQSGQLDAAEKLYRQILQADPQNANAWRLLGVLAKQVGRLDLAAEYIRHTLRLRPENAEAHILLGSILSDQGENAAAEMCYRQALRLKPDYPEALNSLGILLYEQGKVEEAGSSFQAALRLRPNFAEALINRGNVLRERGKLEDAEACYREALRLKPGSAEAHCNLGVVYHELCRLEEAEAHCREALRLKPGYVEAHYNLGNSLRDQGRHEEAMRCFQEAVRFRPGYAAAYNNIGNIFKEEGKLEEALGALRQALQCQPDFVMAHSNLLHTIIFSPNHDAEAIFLEHQRWNQQRAQPLVRYIEPHSNDRSPERRLKIGYVSPDFRQHPVGRWMLPLLEAHDHNCFEIYCYASVKKPDAITARCRTCVDVWREARLATDLQLTNIIRQDRIDILVDITMHMADNRLLVFARKPAPVQATYLAYPGTTGLTAIDYRLTDDHFDPPGWEERFYSEECVRLPDGLSCYHPIVQTPEVNALPALATGHVTFGCLNNFCKVVGPTLEAWGRLLQKLPESRLLLFVPAGASRGRVQDFFAGRGVTPDRVHFVDRAPITDYFWTFHRIDIALDPFPYGGGTTTCDALWMGVPVVTLAGQQVVSRAGLSLLSNANLQELVAHDVDGYVRIAMDLAGDLSRLSVFRAGLRDRLRASPLMDAPRFARNMEVAFRTMWRRWCAGREETGVRSQESGVKSLYFS